jgi:predicted regulator of amino acid metabolism with ACT domain
MTIPIKEIAEDYGVDEAVVTKVIQLTGLHDDLIVICSVLEKITLEHDVSTLDDLNKIL